MKFAKVVFWIAGGLGIPAAISMYFQPGPSYYYASIGPIVAWQFVFFLIASNPARFRQIMLPAVLEKLIWLSTIVYFHLHGQVTAKELTANFAVHGVLGILFATAYVRTPKVPAA
jgi:hypothetical protein